MTDLVVPDSPEDLGLPYLHWRKHQREAVADVLRAYAQGYKHVLLSAPTGSGKTIIGAAVGRVLEGQSLFLSHTIHLQNQQLRTLPEARTATGRSNWECGIKTVMGEPMRASEAPCPPCPKELEGECPYYQQMAEAGLAPEAVLNYAYALRILQAPRLKGFEHNPFRHRGLMVCDEGHLLERALVEAVGVPLNYRTFDAVGLFAPHSQDMDEWREWANDNVHDAEHEVASAHKGYIALLAGESRMPHAEKSVLTTYRHWHAVHQALRALLDLSDETVHLQPTQTGYKARPLWVWNLLPDKLFQHADRVLIMSATLGDPEITARLLGLRDYEYAHIEVPSVFPVENRLVFYWPVAKMRHGMPDNEKVRQAQALDELARTFPNSAGVIHCNSFALGRFLAESVSLETRRRIWLHAPDNKCTPLFETQGLRGDLGNAILVTPSATTGVDWDFVGWAMLPKVPFPDLSDDIVRLRTDYVTQEGEPIGQKVYRQEAAMAMVQASGRHIRTETSKGVTIITDSAFYPLFKHLAPGAFPEWFRAAFRWRD